MNLYDLISERANQNPDSLALGAPGQPFLNYHGLENHIRQTVERLNALGIGRNDPVAIVVPNGPEMASAFVSIASGATSAPLNPAYQTPEYEFYLTDLDAKALVIDQNFDSPAREVAKAKGIPVLELVVDKSQPAGLFTLEGEAQPLTAEAGFAEDTDVALVLHTSGTTSRPKIVPLQHKNVLATARNIRSTLHLTPEDRCLNIMPLFHIHGLMAAVLSSLGAGATVVCTPGYYATDFYGWLEEFAPTWYTAVPTMHQSILSRAEQNQDVIAKTHLRFIRSSSSSLAPQVMKQLNDTFHAPVVEAYGMTEAAHQMACNPLTPGGQKPGSVGPAAGPEVAIMSENGPELLAQGKLGEIVIRGENVFGGYANNPEANAAAFTDGWFRTGDQGFMDEDGYLYLTGRLKEIINRGGEKISPREIDEVLLDHAGVAQALTFAMPDVNLGEEVAAAVVLKDASLTERDIRQYAAEKLADFKVPRRVVILDEIPKGATGKLQRIGLAEKLGITAEPAKAQKREFVRPRTPLEEALANIWREQLDLEEIGVHDRFIEMGGDSMLAARLVQKVSKQFGVRINLTDFSDTPTIEEQAEFLQSLGVTVSRAVEKTENLVTAIHPNGSKPPLFFMSASTADAFIFSGLGKGLGEDQPLYGLTPYKLDVHAQPDQVAYLAARYLQEIKRIKPHGPYLLGGNCSGGVVAFEIARTLMAAGEQVDYLLMTEAYGLDYPKRTGLAKLFGGVLQFAFLFKKHQDSLQASSSLGRRVYMGSLWRKQARRIGNFWRRLRGKQEKLPPVSQRSYDFRTGVNYNPKPLACDVYLFRAAYQPYGVRKDETLGWGALVDGEVRVTVVPGYHGGLYPGDRAQNLGALIKMQLEKVHGE